MPRLSATSLLNGGIGALKMRVVTRADVGDEKLLFELSGYCANAPPPDKVPSAWIE